ncbi:MAG: class I SAM-dependent methyltransferase family protein [Candidatus Methanomethylophilaceae archaeon]|jgi:tRNA (guanine37-N1)-methyltransferase
MVRCIRVPKKDGEAVRSVLREKGLLDLDSRIRSDSNCLLIPILSASYGDYPVVDAELRVQEHRETDYRELLDIPDDLKKELPNSHDVIGDVLLLKLTDDLLPYKHDIGEALMRTTPNIRTVMLDSGVKGDFRIRELEQIVGTGSSETVHREFGVRMLTDPAKVYFNPRLATERARVASLVRDGETIIDMFAGVAPFGTVICKCARPKIVYSIDLNPEAEHFAKRNAELNHIDNLVPMTGDAREVVKDLPDADRIIMNLPQMAEQFLPDALAKAKPGAMIHLHKIMERTELGSFRDGLGPKMAELGLGMHIDRVSEMKTYSPTMSVYVFDIVRD